MSKGFLASLAGLLAGASLVLGQSPPPAATPPAEEAPPPPPHQGLWEEFKSSGCWGCAGPSQRGIATASAEWVFWFFPKSREETFIGGFRLINDRGIPLGDLIPLSTLGEEQFERHITNGGRFSLGYWLTECLPSAPDYSVRTMGGEVRFFFVGQRSVTFENDFSPVLVRPFFDLNNREERGLPIAAPGLATGTLAATAERDLWGVEANFWRNLCYDYPETVLSLEAIAGVRYVEHDPNITIAATSIFDNTIAFPLYAAFAGNRIDMRELFATRSQFVGPQFGVCGKLIFEDLVVSATAKLALGVTEQELHIEGNSVRTLPNGTQIVSQGALLALPSNIGRFHRTKFGYFPEFNLDLTYPIWKHLSVKAGFTAMYWNRVLRPSDQIDRVIDATQIPNYPLAAFATPTGLNRPNVSFIQTDLWLLGGTVGVEVVW
jgi:hypothetical protein